jgi:hypothetical protein
MLSINDQTSPLALQRSIIDFGELSPTELETSELARHCRDRPIFWSAARRFPRGTSMIEWEPIETAPWNQTHLLLWLPAPFSKPAIGDWDRNLLCWVVEDSTPDTDELLPTHWVSITAGL